MYTLGRTTYGYAITGGTLVDSGANWVTITAEGRSHPDRQKVHPHHATGQRQNPRALAAERGNVVRGWGRPRC